MTIAALKKKIKALVDRETNAKRLEKVHATLTAETRAEATRRTLNEVVQASERDIKAGRTMSIDELSLSMHKYVEEIYSGTQGKVAASRKPKLARLRGTNPAGK